MNDWNPTLGDPTWVYRLQPGDELKPYDAGRIGHVVYFQRVLSKNLSFVTADGRAFRGRPGMFASWRRGKPDNLKAEESGRKWKHDAQGLLTLTPGDPILLIMSDTRYYIGFFEQLKGDKIHWKDLRGKAYKCEADLFLCKLPKERFEKC